MLTNVKCTLQCIDNLCYKLPSSILHHLDGSIDVYFQFEANKLRSLGTIIRVSVIIQLYLAYI